MSVNSISGGIAGLGIHAGNTDPTNVAAPAADAPTAHYQTIDVARLLQRKLEQPTLRLNTEESIALLGECIRQGEQQAGGAVHSEFVVFVGNTGSGKSTLGNYLLGCTMERRDPRDFGISGLDEDIVLVQSIARGGSVDEVMPIGHSKRSMTFIPQIATRPGMPVLCDCPGFLDNRGYEINIANAVNVRNVLLKASEVKVILLINWYTLKAERARGLVDLIKIACDLFGSHDNLVKCKQSVLVGVTQIPTAAKSRRALEDLRSFMADITLTDDFQKIALQSLIERVFIYDPLDEPLTYSGSWNRSELLEEIRRLPPITNSSRIFQTVLTAEDEQGLVRISQAIKAGIEEVFSKPNLEEEDFKKIADYQKNLSRLEVIVHPQVTALVREAKGAIINHLQAMVAAFERDYSAAAQQLSTQSEQLFNRIQQGVRYFDTEIQTAVNISGAEERYARYKKSQEAKTLANSLRVLERNGWEYLQIKNFIDCAAVLAIMRDKIQLFNAQYSTTDIGADVDFEKLERSYQTAKAHEDQRKAEVQREIDQGVFKFRSVEEKFNRCLAEAPKDRTKFKDAEILSNEMHALAQQVRPIILREHGQAADLLTLDSQRSNFQAALQAANESEPSMGPFGPSVPMDDIGPRAQLFGGGEARYIGPLFNRGTYLESEYGVKHPIIGRYVPLPSVPCVTRPWFIKAQDKVYEVSEDGRFVTLLNPEAEAKARTRNFFYT